MSRRTRILSLIALSGMLSGCWLFQHSLDYELVGTETAVDPATGDITRTFHWKYEDGDEVTTTDVIHRGEDNEQRRNDRPTPSLRFSEAP